MVSNIFAHLPNGIIREIVSYTGATYKKRNGKYIGQIPKDDPRYAILQTIPKMEVVRSMTFECYNGEPGIEIIHCAANLTRYKYDLIYEAHFRFGIVKTIDISNNIILIDYTYTFDIEGFSDKNGLPYSRKYLFEEGGNFEKRKNLEKYGQRVRILLEMVWFGISCSISYYVGCYLGSANV